MLNALYTVATTSPNGAVKRDMLVAARSEAEAREFLLRHELVGRDGYHVGNAHLVGDLEENHNAKYAATPSLVGTGVAR